MAKGGKLMHPAQPEEESSSHTERACPILFLSIDDKTLRYAVKQRSAQ
jgi:hypothetical protein